MKKTFQPRDNAVNTMWLRDNAVNKSISCEQDFPTPSQCGQYHVKKIFQPRANAVNTMWRRLFNPDTMRSIRCEEDFSTPSQCGQYHVNRIFQPRANAVNTMWKRLFKPEPVRLIPCKTLGAELVDQKQEFIWKFGNSVMFSKCVQSRWMHKQKGFAFSSSVSLAVLKFYAFCLN